MNSIMDISSAKFSFVYGLATVVLVYIACTVAYNLLLSPLRSVPGPWYAAISSVWINIQALRLRKCRAIEELFDEYGPVVRVAPNYVVFRDVNAMKQVYGATSKFDKGVWYKALVTNENDHAMTTLPSGPHLLRKRGYAPHYTPSHLASFQPELHDFTLGLVHRIEGIAGKAPVDTLSLFRSLMVDVIYATLYGESVNAVQKWGTKSQDLTSQSINDFPKRGLVRGAVPSWLWPILSNIPITRWKQLCDCERTISSFIIRQVQLKRAEILEGKVEKELDGSSKVPLLARLLRYKINGVEMSDKDIISECMGHTIAGVDTTSTTASYLCWELARRPEVMHKLQAELDRAMPDRHVILDAQILQRLPYLDALIKEVLRVYGAAPSPLPRVVPPGCTTLGTFDIPAGTTVATQSWSMHRVRDVFVDASLFNPDRWLTGEGVNVMQAHCIPFGYGPRTCGGQNLAVLMLKILAAALARNFDITADKGTDEAAMWMCDAFVIFPWAGVCNLSFHPRLSKE